MKTCLIEGVMPSIEVKLFHTEKKYLKAIKKQGYTPTPLDSDAETSIVRLKDGSIVSFVLIREIKVEYEKQLALLCHEAVHIAQDYFERVGEDKPAMEEQAYVIQSIFQCLALEHRRWVDTHKEMLQ